MLIFCEFAQVGLTSVAAAETTADGLAGDGTDTQGAIDAAQEDHDAAQVKVTALPDSAVKTDLGERLSDVQTAIDHAQPELDIVNDLQTAINLANALDEDNYSTPSWVDLQTALDMTAANSADRVSKTSAINNAVASLIFRQVTTVTITLTNPGDATGIPVLMFHPGAFNHFPFTATILDQSSNTMLTKGVEWSLSGAHSSDFLQQQSGSSVMLSIEHNSSIRTVVLRATCEGVEGTYSVPAVVD